MKNKWNLFWKDYGAELKRDFRFCRKHWFATLMYCAFMVLYYLAAFTELFDDFYCWIWDVASDLKEKATSVFKKGKHEK